MLEIAIYLVVLIILIFALVKLIDKFVTPGNKKVFTIVLWGISLFLVYLIYASIMKPIEFQNEKDAMLFKNIKSGSLVPVRSSDLNRIGEILIKTQEKQAL